MDRRSFLSGSAWAAALPTIFGSMSRAEAAHVRHGTPAIAHIDIWWDIQDKRGTDGDDHKSRYRIESIVRDRMETATDALTAAGFVVPSHRCGNASDPYCLHQPRNGMSRDDRFSWDDPNNVEGRAFRDFMESAHKRFDCRCGSTWMADWTPFKGCEHTKKGDVRMEVVMHHPGLVMSPDEVLTLLAERSLGISSAELQIIEETKKTARMVRA